MVRRTGKMSPDFLEIETQTLRPPRLSGGSLLTFTVDLEELRSFTIDGAAADEVPELFNLDCGSKADM